MPPNTLKVTAARPRPVPREVALGRAHELIAAKELDALVATSHASTFYFAGTNFTSQRALQERLALVVVQETGEPTLIVEQTEAEQARSTSWIDRVQTYREFHEQPMDILAGLLRAQGHQEGRIGVEKEMLGARHAEALRAKCPQAELVDVDPDLQHMRAIKTPAETRILGELALNTIRAIHEGYAGARVGETEVELGERMKAAARHLGIFQLTHLILGSGRNAAKPHHEPDGTRLAPSTIVRVDMGLMDQGYGSDVARTVIVGPALPHQIDTYKRLEEIFHTVVAAMRPGLRTDEIYSLYLAACERQGMESGGNHVGHSISMNIQNRFETPALHAFDHTELEAGMVFMVEPRVRGKDGRYHVEDLVEITTGEPRIWSRTSEWDLAEPMVIG